MSAPKLRDVRKLADSRAVIELDIPLVELPGFPTEFVLGAGHVHARLSFGREQGYAMARVDLQAELSATCQRCLGPMPLRVEMSSPVLIVESEQEGEAAPAGWETFLAPEGRLMFAALAAEELLLALPIVPLHENVMQCQPLVAQSAVAHVGTTPADATQTGAVARPAATDGPTAAHGRGAVQVGAEAPEQATVRPFADLRALLERGAKAEKKGK